MCQKSGGLSLSAAGEKGFFRAAGHEAGHAAGLEARAQSLGQLRACARDEHGGGIASHQPSFLFMARTPSAMILSEPTRQNTRHPVSS